MEMLDAAGLVVTHFWRTVVPPFATELAVDPNDVDAGVVADALRVPESTTYQFVVRAVRATPDATHESTKVMAAARRDDETGRRALIRSMEDGAVELTKQRVRELERRLDAVSRELDRARTDLTLSAEEAAAARARVDEIERSTAYRVITAYRVRINRWFPPGSRRRRAARPLTRLARVHW